MVKDRFAKQLWMSAGIILGSIALAVGALIFLSGEMSTRASAIKSDRQVVQENTDAVSTLAQLQAAVPIAAQYEEAISQIIPDEYGLVTFPQWLSALGTRYGVTTNSSLQAVAAPARENVAGTAQFSFTADGSPSDLGAFLDSMVSQSAGFLVSLTSFSVVSDGTNQKITGQGILFSR